MKSKKSKILGSSQRRGRGGQGNSEGRRSDGISSRKGLCCVSLKSCLLGMLFISGLLISFILYSAINLEPAVAGSRKIASGFVEKAVNLEEAALHEIDKIFLHPPSKSLSHTSTVPAPQTPPTTSDKPMTTSTSTSSTMSSQRVAFPSQCPDSIANLIKFWKDGDGDEGAEVFTSPLRATSGKSAPLLDQRYLVFQSDLGGWNNIRMALETVIIIALVTGRILVLPPPAVLYLLHMNKKWDNNFSGVEEFVDFKRLTAANGLETMPMKEFLQTIAAPGLLSLPLPNNDTNLRKQPLFDYLEKACYVRQWSHGKMFLGFNITETTSTSSLGSGTGLGLGSGSEGSNTLKPLIGTLSNVDKARLLAHASVGQKNPREMLPYDEEFHSRRAIYFPGHDKNRLLTHFYAFLFFAEPSMERRIKRFVRDRLRYHDAVYCTAGKIVGMLKSLAEQENAVIRDDAKDSSSSAHGNANANPNPNAHTRDFHYVSFHIRRGDFQHKHTQLEAEEILRLTEPLVSNRGNKIAYISTDEKNRTFFIPFLKTFKAVRFLSDFEPVVAGLNQNYLGMIEQVICANSHTFIGTPLSTFTSYITRMRGFMNNTIEGAGVYTRSYYFMKNQMYQLHQKPHMFTPFWVREFVEAFQNIDQP